MIGIVNYQLIRFLFTILLLIMIHDPQYMCIVCKTKLKCLTRNVVLLPTRLRCAAIYYYTMKILWFCSSMNFWIIWVLLFKQRSLDICFVFCYENNECIHELGILLRSDSDRGDKLIYFFLHLCRICWFVLFSVLFLANFII